MGNKNTLKGAVVEIAGASFFDWGSTESPVSIHRQNQTAASYRSRSNLGPPANPNR